MTTRVIGNQKGNHSDASSTLRALVIEVVGTPAPQGSKSFKGMRGGRAVLVESCAAVGPWRDAVAWLARAAMNLAGWVKPTGPVSVTIEFRLRRPPSTPKTRTWPDRRPDLDKLIRSTLDGLTTAGVYEDDARVVLITAGKIYAAGPTGAIITITPYP